MNKSDILKKKKCLKRRQRSNKIKKQNNYNSKTHKGTNKYYLQKNLKRNLEKDKKEKQIWQTLKEKMVM